jgi:predicted cobalt transporter CbtA
MKDFRRLFVAVLLTAVLAVSAWAGEVQTPGAPAPGDGHSPGAAVTGDVHSPAAPTPGDGHGPGAPNALGDVSTPGFAAMLLALLSY